MDFNDRATGDAAILVAITQVLLAFAGGTSILGLLNPITLIQIMLAGLIFWLLYSGVTYAVSRFLLDGQGTFAPVLRLTVPLLTPIAVKSPVAVVPFQGVVLQNKIEIHFHSTGHHLALQPAFVAVHTPLGSVDPFAAGPELNAGIAWKLYGIFPRPNRATHKCLFQRIPCETDPFGRGQKRLFTDVSFTSGIEDVP